MNRVHASNHSATLPPSNCLWLLNYLQLNKKKRFTCTIVLGLSFSDARTSNISPAFVPTRIFSPVQYVLLTDRPDKKKRCGVTIQAAQNFTHLQDKKILGIKLSRDHNKTSLSLVNQTSKVNKIFIIIMLSFPNEGTFKKR